MKLIMLNIYLVGLILNLLKFLKKFIGLDVEDTANIEAVDNKGMEIKMHLNFTQNNPERYCKVVGEKGIIKLDLINNEVIHLKNKNNSKVLFSSTESNDMYLDMFEVFLNAE